MTTADPRATARFLGAFFDELARWGVRDVVVSPGSRSTPLSMVAFELSRRSPERLRLFVDVDERGAAFLALGMAKASGRPVAVVCTSGSAVANYYPAVMEAESSRVPLVVLTGDRPPQLQGLGAPQTCDQLHAFASHVRAFRAMPLPAGDEESLAFARQAAREACIAACGPGALPAGGAGATGGGARVPGGDKVSPSDESMRISGACFGGPVHLNFPFDEPLKPAVDLDDLFDGGRATQVGAAAAPMGLLQANASLDAAARAQLTDLLSGGALLLAGEGSCATRAEVSVVLAFARRFSLPVLADPLSGLRSFDDPHVIANYDSVLKKGGVAPDEALSAQVVVRFGRYPISKRATQWARRLSQAGAAEVVVDPLETRDTNAATSLFVRMAPIDFARAMVEGSAVGAASKAGPRVAAPSPAQAKLLAAWQAADAAAERRIASVADGPQTAEPAGFAEEASSAETSASVGVPAPDEAPASPDAFEGAYVRRVLDLAPANSCLFAANSMSVRAVDTFLTRSGKLLCVLANRGLNGIDGTVSTAIGTAQHFDRTTFVTGDLTMLHDLNALALQRELRVQAALSPAPAGAPARGITIVLLNNNGGAIFDMLPQKSQDDYFERLFLTPQDVDFAQASAAFGVPYAKVGSVEAFDQAYRESLDVAGISLIEVPVPLSGVTQRYGAYW